MNKFLKVCAMALVFAGAISEVEGLAPATLGTPVDSGQVECEATIRAELNVSFENMSKKLVFFENNQVTSEDKRTLEFDVTTNSGRHFLQIVPVDGALLKEGKLYLLRSGGSQDDANDLLELTVKGSDADAGDIAFDDTLAADVKKVAAGKWKIRFDVSAVSELNNGQNLGDYKGSVKLEFSAE